MTLNHYAKASCVVCILACNFFGCITKDSHVDEPIFKGKRLSEWLNNFGYDGDLRTQAEINRNEQAEGAIRSMGPNVLPHLLKAIQSNDSTIRHQGMSALCAVGSNAAPAIPQLTFLLQDGRPQTARFAAVVLGCIGSEATPALLKGFTNGNPELQSITLDALAKNGAESSVAIPYLIAALDHSATNLNERIISALGQIGSKPDKVVPLLINYLEHSYYGYRFCAAEALKGFSDKAKPAIPLLRKMLNDEHAWVREAAAETLQGLRP
ncbi:MAG: HEAT repeat domain-containing protein [Verrucomicrobiota bacterium]